MKTVENEVMNSPDTLFDENYESPKQEMSSDELQSLDTIHVKYWELPKDCKYLGGYFAPYHDVMVYQGTDGKYYSTWSYIGE